MKRTLLLLIGLSLLTMEGIAQRGQGRGRGHEKDRGRQHETTINRHTPNNYSRQHPKYVSPRQRNRHHVYAHRGNDRVIIRHSPGIRYQRPIVVRPYVHVRYNRGYVNRYVLSTGQVNAIAENMSYARFDDDALQIAKNRIRRNGIRSEDVAYLMSQLHFEDNKLDLAKFAWRNTVDKRNYNLVFNELRFRSSQNDLDRYINRF